jgi:exonuclease VII small subunit
MRTSSVVVLAAIALTGRAAGGDSIGVLAVAPPPGPGPELVEMTTQLRQMLSERAPNVLDARQLRERMTGEPPGASLSEHDLGYESARAAFVKSDYEGSIRTLRTIVEELEKLPDGEEVFKQWTRAMLRLAKAEQELGHTAEAQNVLDRLVRAEPNVEVDPALYPPDFARLVRGATARLKLSPVRRLMVSSHSRDVQIFVSGREVGRIDRGPVAVRLPAGRYRVSGARGALRAPAVQVDLGRSDQSITLEFSVAESLRPSTGPALLSLTRSRRGRMAAGFQAQDPRRGAVRRAAGANTLGASTTCARKLDHEGRVGSSTTRSQRAGQPRWPGSSSRSRSKPASRSERAATATGRLRSSTSRGRTRSMPRDRRPWAGSPSGRGSRPSSQAAWPAGRPSRRAATTTRPTSVGPDGSVPFERAV